MILVLSLSLISVMMRIGEFHSAGILCECANYARNVVTATVLVAQNERLEPTTNPTNKNIDRKKNRPLLMTLTRMMTMRGG
jgi:hypothetical protein